MIFIVSKEDATEQYKNAVDMVQAIETYIKH